MIRSAWLLFIASSLSLLLVSCDKKESATEATEAVPPAPPPPVEPAPMPAAVANPVDVATLPVEEDFEQEAEKEITAENLVSKLDAIEKEISAE